MAEQLVVGREKFFFGYEFGIQGGKLPDDAIDYYVELLSQPDMLPGSFGFYRAWDATMAQNDDRGATATRDARAGDRRRGELGPSVGGAMGDLATDVQTLVIPGTGHWVAEEAPDELLDGADGVPGAVRRCRVDSHRRLTDVRASAHSVARRGNRVAQLRATRPRRAARPRRPGRLLDTDVHQLAAHTALHPRLVGAYRSEGLLVIGVHTPEFSFEHDIDRVRSRH